ncbi:multidrug efflux pump [Pseudomonas duriflava]|uniref:Multidrug efflux pump n=1 Tax=Pseudomonas duriflava TaxID=459528 RepID=A0A562Q7R8_9PSED|nr:multidrug efflux RND transporter permease subunit [Pseudomonas duriflava]TWI52758.1 multidrug efflux pump [Pseudomonas duriflava]
MNFSALFICRPVATLLLTLAIVLSGWLAFGLLPVAPLPQVDFPTIVVTGTLSGASPETMASSVATPLERSLGRISGITEMTSTSSQGSAMVILQFDLNKDINGAAREVQAAINAAVPSLPTGMPSNPTYRKINPADMPIMVLALTSDVLDKGTLYDLASNTVALKLASAKGVGQVSVGGSSAPAVRIDLNPDALNHYGLSLDDVRTVIAAANSNTPKGAFERGDLHWEIDANSRLNRASDYRPLIIRTRDGHVARLSDVATITDSVEDTRNLGFSNNSPAILILISRQAGANIIETIDGIRADLPALQESLGDKVSLKIMDDRSPGIRSSLHEAEFTLMVSVALVILVVFLFLQDLRATLIPSIVVPISLVGTFAVMYLCNFSLNNLSLMALIVCTGFVVDDAIVVVEYIARRIEEGEKPFQAALLGAREVGFTVLSMSLSLVAVFLPILLLTGVIGRLFREFAVTLSVAVLVSMLVSLTLTPMLCARLLRARKPSKDTPANRRASRFIASMVQRYRNSLAWALDHSLLMMVILALTIGLNVYLYAIIPKGFLPDQDTGRLRGFAMADQGISFSGMQAKMEAYRQILMADPAVQNVLGFTGGRGPGGSSTNSGSFFITLKDVSEREPITAVAARLRKAAGQVAGSSLFLVPSQDFRAGGREGNGSYQYTVRSDDLELLKTWIPKIEGVLRKVPQIVDVNSDYQNKGVELHLDIDRDTASRLGVDMEMISAVLNNSFAQRQVSTIYEDRNQYHVVLGVADPYKQSVDILSQVYVITGEGNRVPLSSFTRYRFDNAPLRVAHDGQFAASTFSFELAQDVSIEQARTAIREAVLPLKLPIDLQTVFAGNASLAQQSQSAMPLIIIAALVAVYIVLGILYESYIHPLTILSTLPSAGVGALVALQLFNTQFTLIALIGIILLIGIVKKNAIMIVDSALDAERRLGLAPREAILDGCVKRFRPIMMTTLAAVLGALPLLLGTGGDAPLRRPLGITIIGGLVGSQLLTLYTTPVIYLYLDRLRHWFNRRWAGWQGHAPMEKST